jgi:hypothetical protein
MVAMDVDSAAGRGSVQSGGSGDWSLADLLAGDLGRLPSLTRDAFGFDADPYLLRTVVETVAYPFGSPATAALLRVRGDGPDGPWTLFCKVLQHVRHWPLLHLLPPDAQEEFANDLPWRAELELWDDVMLPTFPTGLRPPQLHATIDLGDDRLAVWMEDVEESDEPWDLARYARAGHLVGRWNARSRGREVLESCGLPKGFALRMYAEKAVAHRGLEPLASDELWSHPWLAPHADLRRQLLDLAPRIPGLLDRLDAMEQTLPHGDASPQNLLVPADDPETFVAIDISFRSPHALGMDLSQLLLGLTHAGIVPAADLPGVAGAILPAYVEGLRAEGWAGDPDEVGWAFAVTTLLRSGFDGFRYELLSSPVEDPSADDSAARAEFDTRIDMARFIAHRARGVLTP